ncbi:hypothetical protein AX774_g2615, partial [Zancudomyces culisetae]
FLRSVSSPDSTITCTPAFNAANRTAASLSWNALINACFTDSRSCPNNTCGLPLNIRYADSRTCAFPDPLIPINPPTTLPQTLASLVAPHAASHIPALANIVLAAVLPTLGLASALPLFVLNCRLTTGFAVFAP